MKTKGFFEKGQGTLKKAVIGAIISFSFCIAFAQPPKMLTAKDKEVIIEIFKTIDDKSYRFSFGDQETYGNKYLPKLMPASLQKGSHPTLSGHIVKTYYPTMNFWFVVTKPKPPAEGLEGIFGKANAARLEALIKKYTAG